MKSERITFLASPRFKADLVELAEAEELSVAELIRRRFGEEQEPGSAEQESQQEQELRALTQQARRELEAAQLDLRASLRQARATLDRLRAAREARQAQEELEPVGQWQYVQPDHASEVA